MPHFRPKGRKTDDEGREVTTYLDGHNAWFVGAAGDPETDPTPMGAFISEQAARRWADRKYPGGTWSSRGATRWGTVLFS